SLEGRGIEDLVSSNRSGGVRIANQFGPYAAAHIAGRSRRRSIGNGYVDRQAALHQAGTVKLPAAESLLVPGSPSAPPRQRIDIAGRPNLPPAITRRP